VESTNRKLLKSCFAALASFLICYLLLSLLVGQFEAMNPEAVKQPDTTNVQFGTILTAVFVWPVSTITGLITAFIMWNKLRNK
jgi:ABC-type Fe3+ transport system permease subunit